MITVRLTPQKTATERPRGSENIIFTDPHLVLVEGLDDQAVMAALIKHEALDGFHVHNMGGKTDWPKKVAAVTLEPTFHMSVKSVGLVRDADQSPSDAWDSCCNALASARLPVPRKAIEVCRDAGATVATSIAIVPSRETHGAMEELCLSALDKQRVACADGYLTCIERSTFGPRQKAKARLQVYLAGLPRSPGSLNIAVQQDAFDMSHNAFDGLRAFLRGLHEAGSHIAEAE